MTENLNVDRKKSFWRFSFRDAKAAFLKKNPEDHVPRYSKQYVFWTVGMTGIVLASLSGIGGFYLIYGKMPPMASVYLIGICVGLFLGIGWASARSAIEISAKNDLRPVSKALDVAETKGWEGFDPDAAEYPEQLDIALQAWRAISVKRKEGPIKEQLAKWVNENYPGQPASAIERISTIANWDKTGGRPKQRP